MTQQPIKLTEALIDGIILPAIDAYVDDDYRTAKGVVAAIRALRDRAKAVVERYTDHSGICEEDGCDVCPAIKVLMEVLP